ncbi:MAG: hypothetical protein ACI8P3_001606 [Saprospiraceae bacterium]|jgi:hypothetical protein
MKIKKIVYLFLVIGIFSCSNKDDDDNAINCDKQVVISIDEYNTAPDDALAINELEINENCLKINFSASGCDGGSWVLTLIDSGDIMESQPPQRTLRLSLKDEEECEAYITKELTFDISDLMVDGNQVLLNITNSNDQLLYEY